jgi:YebC/PmpR family DNA-binding regulatory protein
MSGHSKWAGIKHKKALIDAKRGKLFSKLVREITVTARQGGGDLEANARLRSAVETARGANMPQANIEKAIKRGTGEIPGTHYEEMVLEGYGPGGVAVMFEITTDNKNRTMAEIKHLLSQNGGHLGAAGCVNWLFSKKGLIVLDKKEAEEDKLLSLALEAGAEDLRSGNDTFEIITEVNNFSKVKDAIEKNNIKFTYASLTMIPKNLVKLESKEAEQVLRLVESLDDHDDIQHVYANFDIPDEILEKMSEQSSGD